MGNVDQAAIKHSALVWSKPRNILTAIQYASISIRFNATFIYSKRLRLSYFLPEVYSLVLSFQVMSISICLFLVTEYLIQSRVHICLVSEYLSYSLSYLSQKNTKMIVKNRISTLYIFYIGFSLFSIKQTKEIIVTNGHQPPAMSLSY